MDDKEGRIVRPNVVLEGVFIIFFGALLVGACTIVWQRAMSVETQVETHTKGLKEQNEQVKALITTLQGELDNIMTKLNEISQANENFHGEFSSIVTRVDSLEEDMEILDIFPNFSVQQPVDYGLKAKPMIDKPSLDDMLMQFSMPQKQMGNLMDKLPKTPTLEALK